MKWKVGPITFCRVVAWCSVFTLCVTTCLNYKRVYKWNFQNNHTVDCNRCDSLKQTTFIVVGFIKVLRNLSLTIKYEFRCPSSYDIFLRLCSTVWVATTWFILDNFVVNVWVHFPRSTRDNMELIENVET